MVIAGVYLGFVLVVIITFRRVGRREELLALVLGGLGNLLPRLWWGSVWDYLYLPLAGLWFNLCDVLICVGGLAFGLREAGILDHDGHNYIVRRHRDSGRQ